MKNLSPETFLDEWFGCLDPIQRLLWIGLLISCADDQGRLINNPVLIRAKIFPYDQLVTTEQIQSHLKYFETAHKLLAYPLCQNGSTGECLQILNWWKYQKRTAWAAPSKLPAPENWIDRIRAHMPGHGTIPVQINWDRAGGFSTTPKEPLHSDYATATQPLHSDYATATQPLHSDYAATTKPLRSREEEEEDEEEEEEEKSLIHTKAVSPVITQTPSPTPELIKNKKSKSGSVSRKTRSGKQVYQSGYTNFPENPAQAMEHPIIGLFEKVTGRIPGVSQYKTVIETILFIRQKKTKPLQSVVDYLKPYWLTWSSRKSQTGKPYSPANLTWLTEWAVNGSIPEPGTAEQPLVHPPSVEATHKRQAKSDAKKFVPPPKEVLEKIRSLKSKLSKE